MQKKKLVICLSIIVSVLLVGFAALIFLSKPIVVYKEDFFIELGEQCESDCAIERVRHGYISQKDVIDTTQNGKQTIEVKIKDYLFREFCVTYDVEVKDTKAPVIENNDQIYIVAGCTENDLKEKIVVNDNDQLALQIELNGNYDLNKAGGYDLTIKATDSAGNYSEKTVRFVVEVAGEQASEYFTTPKGFLGYVKDQCTYIDGVIIVNKTYSLKPGYATGFQDDFSENYNAMVARAKEDGYVLTVNSGFRSNSHQKSLYNYWVGRLGKAQADKESARPGHSEHETGYAVDTTRVNEKFKNDPEYKWLQQNCYKYGFILRYPEGKTDITGYIYEPWHYRYVGVDLATKLWNNGDWITMEEYFGIDSVYQD